MAYVRTNYRTKKEFLAAVKSGIQLEVFNPSGMFPVNDGNNTVEGPHYPEPHRWYSQVVVENGYVVKAK